MTFRFNSSVLARAVVLVALTVSPLRASASLSAQAQAARPAAGSIGILFHSDSDPFKIGTNKIQVTVKDGTHRVRNADVSVVLTAPTDLENDGPAAKTVTLKHYGDGIYRGTAAIDMGGSWSAKVVVKRAGAEIGSRTLTVTAK